uniref:restriction endonuclease n=1 Tax=Sphingomonas sp. TaxID=28214 RepID=UPI001599B829|nr:restriction endonuclease [Sphingomonas sp.]QJS06591.1 type II restriction endonuclease [Sphingomonas sp.]
MIWSIFKRAVPSQVSLPPRDPSLNKEEIIGFLNFMCNSGPHLRYAGKKIEFLSLYARMNGFAGDAERNPDEFQDAICFTLESTPETISRATKDLYEGMDFICKSSLSNLIFDDSEFLELTSEGVPVFRILESIRGTDFKTICVNVGLDVEEYLISASSFRRNHDIQQIISKIEEKETYLKPILLRALSRGKNEYGDINYESYVTEIAKFLGTYFPSKSLKFYNSRYPITLIHNHVTDYWLPKDEELQDMPKDGIDFEYWCASKLEEQGWATQISKASGDQGVDIEAFKDGVAIAVQCKRYSQPIGNKAVQEAYTGMVHYGAQLSAVIGTGGFTKSAIELAGNTGVLLLDADNISSFSDLIGNRKN